MLVKSKGLLFSEDAIPTESLVASRTSRLDSLVSAVRRAFSFFASALMKAEAKQEGRELCPRNSFRFAPLAARPALYVYT